MRRTKRIFVSLICFLIFPIACSSGEPAEPTAAAQPKKRPNVILIMADDLGWGDTGYNGNQNLRTPNLDEMAASGVVLQRFYSAAPVCSPTRASVLTGRHPFREKVFFAMVGDSQNGLPPSEVTLGKLMKHRAIRFMPTPLAGAIAGSKVKVFILNIFFSFLYVTIKFF